MVVCDTDCYMPPEMLDLIAAVDEQSYRAMLAVPLFARSLTPGKVVDFMIAFGYSVKITKYYIGWYLNGYLRRQARHGEPDGPAVEREGGDKEWWLNGKKHRDDGPAIERANGDKVWYLYGKEHRDDGPAVEYANGDKLWYLYGKLHRQDRILNPVSSGGESDGPAVEYTDGYKAWWLNGKRHRVDGPAVEHEDGRREWYLNGFRQPDQ
jgi:hypothetical protein